MPTVLPLAAASTVEPEGLRVEDGVPHVPLIVAADAETQLAVLPPRAPEPGHLLLCDVSLAFPAVVEGIALAASAAGASSASVAVARWLTTGGAGAWPPADERSLSSQMEQESPPQVD